MISIVDATTGAKGAVQVGTGIGVSSGTISVTYGTTASTAVQGNDARMNPATVVGDAGKMLRVNAGGTAYEMRTAAEVKTDLGIGTMGAETATDYLSKAGNLSGLASASTARTNLGLGTMSTETAADYLTKAGNLSGLADASAARTNLGLAIGTNVQAYDAQLVDIAGLSATADNFIVGDGTNFVLKTPATARTSLGLGGAAVLNVGTAAGTVAAGDDARLSDARTPTAHVHSAADVTTGTLVAARGGTGATSFTADSLVITNATGTAQQSFAPCANGQVMGSNGTAWGCTTPVSGTDYVAKAGGMMTGALEVATGGTVGAPMLTFAGDTNTGIYNASTADNLVFVTDGVERARFNGSSAFILGGGLATPGASTIRGGQATGTDVAGAALTIEPANGTGTGGSGALIFRTAPTAATSSTANTMAEAMRITPSGNVGIGPGTPTTGTRVDITGTGAAASSIIIPRDTVANRPTTGVNGMLRYASDTNKFEAYENGAWVNMIGGGGAASSVAASVGSAGTPSMGFSGDTDTGLYNASSNNTISIATGGANIFNLSSAGLVSATTGGASITTADGTAAAPTFSFAGDTDTGWWRPAANTMAASTAGAERVRIDSSGNVGIGITSPTAVLDLKAGTASANTAPLKFASGTVLTTPEAGAIEYDGSSLFYTNSNAKRQTIAAGFGAAIQAPPAYANWTWLNQGSATGGNMNGGVYLVAPAAASDSIKALVKTVPASPFTVTAGLSIMLGGSGGYCGLLITNGTNASTSKIMDFELASYAGAQSSFVGYFTNSTTYSSGYFDSGAGFETTSPIIWMKYQDDGTNRIFSISNNGAAWVQLLSQARNTQFVATHIGFFCSANNATSGSTNSLVHWVEQ